MELREVCCFTGHRPERLPWRNNEEDSRCIRAKEELARALGRAVEAGCRHFICGMARGGDFYFAEAVLALRDRRPEITLEGARPYERQSNAWSAADRQRYQDILSRCDYETLVQQSFDRGCLARRNRYMVDHSVRLIALYDGDPHGGTAQTLAYALQKKLEVDIIPVEQEAEP